MPEEKKREFPPQQQALPGREREMHPEPHAEAPWYRAGGKLEGQAAIVTGGDSGIGRAVAVLFAREGADVAIAYLEEHEDAARTRELVEREGRRCLTFAGDLGRKAFCQHVVDKTVEGFGRLDVLVNNAGIQIEQAHFEEISEQQLERVFRTNIYSYFFMAQAAVRHLGEGGSIINTTSVNSFKGHPTLIDYTATKGAITSFTRALALNLAPRGVRVNCVAPGPVWTPLIPSSFDEEHVEQFGGNVPLGRAAQPDEIAPAYVFLAARDGVFFTGQTLHPNGGYVVGA